MGSRWNSYSAVVYCYVVAVTFVVSKAVSQRQL